MPFFVQGNYVCLKVCVHLEVIILLKNLRLTFLLPAALHCYDTNLVLVVQLSFNFLSKEFPKFSYIVRLSTNLTNFITSLTDTRSQKSSQHVELLILFVIYFQSILFLTQYVPFNQNMTVLSHGCTSQQ